MKLSRIQKGSADVQLLITDILMPGMRGTEAAQKIAALIPGL